jgi:hypothetical protein
MLTVPEGVEALRWRKSSRSAGNGNCVEVRFGSGTVAVRDSKDPDGPILEFEVGSWRDFVDSACRGELDLP